MKVAVIGANGQLGSDLMAELARQRWVAVPLTHEDIRIEEMDSVRQVLGAVKPDVVLNTAAYHVVPKCEEDPVRAHQVNALGARNIAMACGDLGARSVYYSTDYVFDGAKGKPYNESDRPNPLNVYAATKLLGEYYNLNYASKSLVLRVSGIYGRVPCRAKGGNFITTMVKAAKDKPEVRVVDDERLSPTATAAIASKTLEILRTEATGLFHVVSEGECSWYEFARVIFSTLGLHTPLRPASVKDFPSTVKRPTYSALENVCLRDCGISPMPHWKDSVITFLRNQYGAA